VLDQCDISLESFVRLFDWYREIDRERIKLQMTPSAKLRCIDGAGRNFLGCRTLLHTFFSLMMQDSSPVNLNFARRPPIVGKLRSLPDVRDSS
jgi:hypothetical protein